MKLWIYNFDRAGLCSCLIFVRAGLQTVHAWLTVGLQNLIVPVS